MVVSTEVALNPDKEYEVVDGQPADLFPGFRCLMRALFRTPGKA